MSATAYKSILHLANSLSREEKLRLIRKLAASTEDSSETDGPEKNRSILELSGLGREIWSKIDAQEYVNSERTSWNGSNISGQVVGLDTDPLIYFIERHPVLSAR
jgi:hypothetical protein